MDKYYCNCSKKKNVTISTFRKVEIDSDKCCKECGYYAVYSETGDFTTTGHSLFEENIERSNKYRYELEVLED